MRCTYCLSHTCPIWIYCYHDVVGDSLFLIEIFLLTRTCTILSRGLSLSLCFSVPFNELNSTASFSALLPQLPYHVSCSISHFEYMNVTWLYSIYARSCSLPFLPILSIWSYRNMTLIKLESRHNLVQLNSIQFNLIYSETVQIRSGQVQYDKQYY